MPFLLPKHPVREQHRGRGVLVAPDHSRNACAAVSHLTPVSYTMCGWAVYRQDCAVGSTGGFEPPRFDPVYPYLIWI